MIRYFGGIDFSGAREPLSNLWSALGEEREGKLCIRELRPHAFRADLAAYVTQGWKNARDGGEHERVLWGADFPFGIPAAALDDLAGQGIRSWQDLLAWAADRPADEVRGLVPTHNRALRATDTGGALPPLDLRLYKQTVEGLRWLHGLREAEAVSIPPLAEEPHARCILIEVYPSGTCRELGLPRRRVPSRPGEARARAASLRTYLVFDDPSLEAIAVTLEDAWDASIAALTAWLCRDDLEQPKRIGVADSVSREGWIYRPPAAL
jgi:hypothetical protein